MWNVHVSVRVLVTLCLFGMSLWAWRTKAEDISGRGQAHFDLMMRNINKVASQLGNIYDSTCGPEECRCSQDLCFPLLVDAKPICQKSVFNTSNIYNCSNFLRTKLGGNAQVCASMMVTTSRSSASYARTDVNTPAAPGAQQSAICRTQQLDSLFQSLAEETPYYVEYFVQTVGGGFRSYPGREENGVSCLSFEGRKRPWFSGVTSVPSHLIILIDCGYSMGANADTWELDGRLKFAQTFALTLLDTVYYDNYVNVFSFGRGDISSELYETPVHVDFDSNNPQSHPELEPLKEKIQSLTVSQNDGSVLVFVNALNTSLRAFNDTQNTLRNIVVFTDGSFTSGNVLSDPSVTAILDQVVSSNVRLWLYGINSGISDAGLQALAKSVDSTYQNIKEFSNPLFSMQAFLGYMGACHKRLFGETGFWSRNYKDYFNVGV